MIQIHNVEQKSDEWFKIREQYPLTASNAHTIAVAGKGLETLCWEIMANKYSFADEDKISTKDLDRGIELEPLARQIYELRTGYIVRKVGFVTDEEISKVGGASPDGDIVNEDGIVEFKAFADVKHFKMIIDFKETGTFEIEKDYQYQMQQQLLFTGKKWVDYSVFNPNFKDSLLIQRVYRNEEIIEQIKKGLKKGEEILKEIKSKMEK
jgi:predicted phage-related endonuclease